jgi:hypothetical protein
MKIIFLLLFPISLLAQSKCDRSTAFTADFSTQFNPSFSKMNASVNIGISSFNQQGQRYNKLSILGGVRIYDAPIAQRTNAAVSEVFLIPQATLMIKQRFNGYESKVVHAVAFTAGAKNFLEASYRIYAAPKSNSFATIGGVISYSNAQQVTFGFIIMGLF